MSAGARKAASNRMKRYWAERRKAQAKVKWSALRLIRRLGRPFPGEAEERMQDLIISYLSTSDLTVEYGPNRPRELEFFKADLRLLVGDEYHRLTLNGRLEPPGIPT